jgi:hypothetical protein
LEEARELRVGKNSDPNGGLELEEPVAFLLKSKKGITIIFGSGFSEEKSHSSTKTKNTKPSFSN